MLDQETREAEDTKPRILIIGSDEAVRETIRRKADGVFGKVVAIMAVNFDEALEKRRGARVDIAVLSHQLIPDRERVHKTRVLQQLGIEHIILCEGRVSRDYDLLVQELMGIRPNLFR